MLLRNKHNLNKTVGHFSEHTGIDPVNFESKHSKYTVESTEGDSARNPSLSRKTDETQKFPDGSKLLQYTITRTSPLSDQKLCDEVFKTMESM